MAATDDIIDKLRKTIKKSKSKSKKDDAAVLDQIVSYLVFMKSATLSSDAASGMYDVFRRQLPALYPTYPQPTLELTSTLCRTLYEDKVLKDFTAGKENQEGRWELVLNAVLSGVLDFLEDEPTDKFKEAIGTALYPVLCSIFFSASISHMSVDLRCTGYSVLSESAEAHRGNQKRLLRPDLLGGIKLGSMLWRTKDYLVLENILNLFARMIPPSGSSAAGRANRKAFIRSAFVDSSPDDVGTGQELANMVEHVNTPDWEQTAGKIVDALAGSNIGFPQPFKVSEVLVGEESSPSDRVFIDGQGFLANVLVADDLFDSLTASYSTVTKVEVANRTFARQGNNQQSFARVTVTLSSPPAIGHKQVHTHGTPTLAFAIDESDIQRLRAALGSRGMGNHFDVQPSAKHSVLRSPAALEIDLGGNLIGKQELEQRIENLSQLYETNEPNDDPDGDFAPEEVVTCIDPSLLTLAPPERIISSSARLTNLAGSSPTHALASTTALKTPGATAAIFAAADSVPTAPVPVPATPIKQTTSQLLRDKAFGTSDDSLSEIECAPEPPKKPRKSVANAILERPSKPLDTTLRKKGRVILDSDDEMPASTPSRPPPKKKVIVVSEDEIEEVVSAAKAMVSRRRSILSMTAITPSEPYSSSRLQSVQSKPKSSGKKSSPTAGNSSDKPITLDSPAAAPRLDVKTTSETRSVTVEQAKKLRDNKQVRLSSPPVQPLKKSVKTALRKKNQPLDNSLVDPEIPKGQKRKQPVEDREEDVSTKRARTDSKIETLAHGDSFGGKSEPPVFEPDIASSGRAKKQYGGRKKRASSPLPVPSQPKIDYDAIPEPASSVSKPGKLHVKSKGASKVSKKVVEKTSNVELNPAKKTARSAVTKGKENETRKMSKEKTEIAAQKTNVEPEEPTKPEVKDERPARAERKSTRITKANVSELANADPLKKLPSVKENDGTPKLSNSAAPRKENNKAPWDDMDASKFNSVDQATNQDIDDQADLDPPPASFEPVELLDFVDDTMPAIVAPADFTAQTVVESTPAKASRIESERAPARTSHKFDAKIVPAEQMRELPERPHSARKASNASPVVADVLEDEVQKDVPEKILEAPVPEPIERKPLDTISLKVPISIPFSKEKMPVAPLFSTAHRGLEAAPKNPSKKIRFEYPEKRVEKPLDTPPGMNDLAKVLQDIQQAILHKITNRVEDVRQDVRRGRELMLDEAAADLAAMRTESIDRYNHLIELEADYASFGRSLTHVLDDLARANREVQGNIEKIIQTHDRGSIVKYAPTSLFSTKRPSSIRRFCS